MNKGISVVICCFNSAKRLENTLQALSVQNCVGICDWEILIVDNASTDDTARKSEEIWKKYQEPTPLRVIQEPRPGLTHARKAGILLAKFDYILFCDDDNWLNSNYLNIGFRILEDYPLLAALGGNGSAVFESQKPAWFDEFREAYAVGSQSLTMEDGKQLSLYGAGMFIRKSCYLNLVAYGFREFLNDRTGNSLSSSGDTELTNAFTIAGYQIMYSADLRFQHFLTTNRLQRRYLEKLFIAFGSDGPLRNVYYSFQTRKKFFKLLRFWLIHLTIALLRLVKYTIIPPKKNARRLYLLWNISYLKSLLKLLGKYSGIYRSISRFKYNAQQKAQASKNQMHDTSPVGNQNYPVAL